MFLKVSAIAQTQSAWSSTRTPGARMARGWCWYKPADRSQSWGVGVRGGGGVGGEVNIEQLE